MGGTCTVNTEEAHLSAGLGHFCLFTAAQVSACIYPERAACDAEAKHQHGVCVAAPNATESPAPDPYRDVRPLTDGGDYPGNGRTGEDPGCGAPRLRLVRRAAKRKNALRYQE
jgi:hypothetical protein